MWNELLLLIVLTVSFDSFSANANSILIEETCRKISESDPDNVKYEFCIAALGSDPRSSTASVAELGQISLEMDISKSKSINASIDQLLKDPKSDPKARGPLLTCSELYSDTPSALEAGLNALKRKDYQTANVKIGAAMDSAIACQDGFKESTGLAFPLSKDNSDFLQITAMSLAFTVLFN